MNVLFLTIVKITSLTERGIYQDLLKCFADDGHSVYVVTPTERREKKKTKLYSEDRINILQVKTFNIQKTNLIEKGVGTLTIEYQYLLAIKKYLSSIKFDLILYSTPPITFSKIIQYIKNRDNAYSYLLLKDIFPQNAVDLKMIKEKGILHHFFSKKEAKLYQISDTIGCMSPANKSYILAHNKGINSNKVEINPNSIYPFQKEISGDESINIKQKYNLPVDKIIFVYGGNLGKPQGLDFLLETIESTGRPDVFFLIVGSGTEYKRMKNWFDQKHPKNAILLTSLARDDYHDLLAVCDVGMLFLHKDFTIPNFPSRLLSYLELHLPIIAATDPATDVGKIIEEAKCGHSILSGDQHTMQEVISQLCDDEIKRLLMAENAWKLLLSNFHVKLSYQLIINKVKHV